MKRNTLPLTNFGLALAINFQGASKSLAHSVKIPACPNRAPTIVDLFNVFNSSAVTTIGPSLLKPSQIDMGRLLRLGGRVTF